VKLLLKHHRRIHSMIDKVLVNDLDQFDRSARAMSIDDFDLNLGFLTCAFVLRNELANFRVNSNEVTSFRDYNSRSYREDIINNCDLNEDIEDVCSKRII